MNNYIIKWVFDNRRIGNILIIKRGRNKGYLVTYWHPELKKMVSDIFFDIDIYKDGSPTTKDLRNQIQYAFEAENYFSEVL